MNQAVNDIDNKQLVTIQLLPEYEVHSEVMSILDLTRTNMPVQLTTTVDFLRIATRSNSLISALNTNVYATRDERSRLDQDLTTESTYFFNKTATNTAGRLSSCQTKSSTTPAGIYPQSQDDRVNSYGHWPEFTGSFEPIASAMIDGFFGACTPFDAVLASTLDCLYNANCIQSLAAHFPKLNHV